MKTNDLDQILDLERFPLDDLDGPTGRALIARCRDDLAQSGATSLEGLIRTDALEACIAEVKPALDTASFIHAREHNVYFDDDIPGLAPDHPVLKRFKTVNHTVCADQIPASKVIQIYHWAPLRAFLAAIMGKEVIYTMPDPLACANVMAYRAGNALNWHFDRSEFTTTLLLQTPDAGGVFEYRPGLRTEQDPNYDGVARFLEGGDEDIQTTDLPPGTLNVFKGRYAAHRITPVTGDRERIIAIFSYYDRPDKTFSNEERMGFYGRSEPYAPPANG